jgi:ketosteroid isomerase-like protein
MSEKYKDTKSDKNILLSIVKEMSESMTGAQSTKYWVNNTIWFDIPAFASQGIKLARNAFDDAFSQLSHCDVEILDSETFINGDMGVICTVQRWETVLKDGTVNPPILVRQTNCFERQNGEWKVIHEHSSIPSNSNWDGKILKETN